MATKRIAVLGGPRCGKTTLIQHLYVEMKIAGLNAGYALEYSTEYLKDKGMIETISEQFLSYLYLLSIQLNTLGHNLHLIQLFSFQHINAVLM